MTVEAERWQRIERIYHEALTYPPEDRYRFLAQACSDDPELYSELESLLARDSSAPSPLDNPAWEGAWSLLEDAAPAPLVAGMRVGPYTVANLIGAGGMGMVYQAEDTKLRRLVALKSLPEELSFQPKAAERLWREARAASALNHPNIATVYSVEEYEGRPFIVMELLEGKSLRQLINGQPVKRVRLLDWAIQITEGLDAAHSKGIIHRDIKPANLFVTSRGQLKILDFGVAKLQGIQVSSGASDSLQPGLVQMPPGDETLTRTGTLIGTVAYMSPEQVSGMELDTRTDLFSCGAVLYEMATGIAPFRGDSPDLIRKLILGTSPLAPRRLNPQVPPRLERIISKALEKDRERRYQQVSEIRDDLRRFAEKKPGRNLRRGIAFAALACLLIAVWWFAHSRPGSAPKGVEHQITANPVEDWVTGAAISPDGKTLAYHDQTGLYVRSVDTGEIRPVPLPDWMRDRIVEMTWFPDNKRLMVPIYTGRIDRWSADAWIVPVNGDSPRLFRREVIHASFSPDGRSVVSLGNDGLWVTGVSGEPQRKLKDHNNDRDWFFSPVWSPDGRWIAYAHMRLTHQGITTALGVEPSSGGPERTVLADSDLGPSAEICYMLAMGTCLSWSRNWRLMFTSAPDSDSPTTSGDFGLWQIPVRQDTAKVAGKPQMLAHWTDIGAISLSQPVDGKGIWFLKAKNWEDVYLADLTPDGALKSPPRRFTLDDRGSYPTAWTPDSQAILLGSERTPEHAIFRQALTETIPQLVIHAPKRDCDEPVLTPDGGWLLFRESDHEVARGTVPPGLLRRQPMAGGTPETVLQEPGDVKWNYGCGTRQGAICVLSRDEGEDTVFYLLDAQRGKGTEISRIAHKSDLNLVDLTQWNVSPDGSRLAYAMSQKRIGILSTRDRRWHEIAVPQPWDHVQSLAWAADGRSLFVVCWRPDSSDLINLTLEGGARPIWHNGHNLWQWIANPLPSPDGKHLALRAWTWDSNVWMLDNF